MVLKYILTLNAIKHMFNGKCIACEPLDCYIHLYCIIAHCWIKFWYFNKICMLTWVVSLLLLIWL